MRQDIFSCEGHVALVTGGTTGIGRACATALADAGARVIIAGIQGTEDSAAQLRTGGHDVTGFDCDVTDSGQLKNVVDAIRQGFGRLDTVVANAGVALDVPDAPDFLERLDRMHAVHVRSVVELAYLTLPLMAATGRGAFIVMSSIAGLRGNRGLGGYGITKAANAEIARNIAVQWGRRGITANALSPGVIDTEFARPITSDPHLADARLAKTPLGRFGRPHEVAGAVVWLASAAGAFVSGQNIVIDGGTLIAD